MEKLTVKNLGPIKDFTMETNRLTVLIGPQASGKSLLAQMLYFFRGAESLLAERYGAEVRGTTSLLNDSVLEILNDIRASDFFDFCEHDTSIEYSNTEIAHGSGYVDYFSDGPCVVEDENGVCECFDDVGIERVECHGDFFDYLDERIDNWVEDKSSLTKSMSSNQVFIPNERSFLSRLINTRQSVLYADYQPLIFRKFAEQVEAAKHDYVSWMRTKRLKRQPLRQPLLPGISGGSAAPDNTVVLGLQRRALSGTVGVAQALGDQWIWQVGGNEGKMLLLGALSSGQSETWPFFALASTFGISEKLCDFYFEEPETHLHPKAQVEVVKTIAYLISRGHRFVITTHSPFILYVINNLIQAHMAYDGNPPEGEFSINPDHVAAYCLGDNPRSIVDEETRLLDLDEIDDVLDSIGKEFYALLNKDFKKNG